MQLLIPNGYFVDDAVIFGDPRDGAIVSKFYDVQFPDLSASDDHAHTDLENDIRLMLSTLREDERLQFLFYTGSNFEHCLNRFEDQTALSAIGVCRAVRTELVNRYRDRMVHETLIRAETRLVLSTKLPKQTAKGFENVFKIISRSFEAREQFFNVLLSTYGCSIKGLNNISNHEEMLRFWSPSCIRNMAENKEEHDWLRTIQHLSLSSGLSPRTEPNHGFYMDGYYFGILVAKSFPRQTWARTMEPFLSLAVPNVRVVLNMQPLMIEAEIQHAEERYQKLISNIDPQHPSLQSEVGLGKHRDAMCRLMQGDPPFKAQLIVVACERTPDKLEERMEALRTCLGKTGSNAFEPTLPTSTLSFFNSATPGYGPWNKYPDYWHKMNSATNVANMWPVASTPSADLDTADWIADGELNNLIGGRHFASDNQQPRHMLVAGSTGDGKSTLLQTIDLQTGYQFKFIAVIDDGLSWMTTCKKLDPTCEPIIIKSNGTQTFNPFQTKGPLTSQHLASATALCHLLMGAHSDQDKDKLRKAILAEAISNVYGVAFRKWRKNHPVAYFDLISEIEQTGWPDAESIAEDQAFSLFTPEMFPTLSDLQDELNTQSLQKGPHMETCAALASLLRPWLRDGIYGPLVDGYSNVSLGSDTGDALPDSLKVVHFELGELGQSESDLRSVAGFLIANEIRNHITSLPRGWHKQVVIEEMVSFLKVPDAEQICVDYWQTMRKFSCQMVAVFQNYSTLLEVSPKVAKALISNSSSLLLLRNHNRQDLDTLGQYVKLPEVVKDQIQRFPKPAELPVAERYAGFVYAQLDGEKPKFTIGRNYISHEVEKITSSTGADYDEKCKRYL